MAEANIQPHNERAAAMWNLGGQDYDRISEGISDALSHAVRRLAPWQGESVLDVGTGTGWTSRLAARCGAVVTGVDIAPDLLAAARRRAAAEGLDVAYRIGDAEALPFMDGAFDAVISTFGVIFAGRPEAAAAELARVCRRDGRIVLTVWTADGTTAELFRMVRSHMPAPAQGAAAPPPSPFEWGRGERLATLLSDRFFLEMEAGTANLRYTGLDEAWQIATSGYGPIRALATSLTPDRLTAFKRDFAAFHLPFRGPMGLTLPCDYLVVRGVRR